MRFRKLNENKADYKQAKIDEYNLSVLNRAYERIKKFSTAKHPMFILSFEDYAGSSNDIKRIAKENDFIIVKIEGDDIYITKKETNE